MGNITIILIVLVAYVVNVFLGRMFNKLVYESDPSYYNIAVKSWFVPFLWLVWLGFYVINKLDEIDWLDEESNWFTGKNWKKDDN